MSNWKYANEDFKFEIDGKDEKVHIIALGSNENGEAITELIRAHRS